MDIHSYPTVFNLGHKAIADLLDGYVLVQEKVDGSQFSFGVSWNGDLEFRSKKVELFDGAPGMFTNAIEYISGIKNQLNPGLVYRGEYLQKPKHNVIAYNRVPRGFVALFDIEMKGAAQLYLSHDDLAIEAARLGFDVVPRLWIGEGLTLENAKGLLDTDSFLGGSKVEGVVIKNYSLFTTEKKVAMGKIVAESFKEVHAGEWKKANPGRADIIEEVIQRYGTHARWRKAIQHLRDEGALQWAPQDIGPLLAEINRDVLSEEADAIKDILFRHFWKEIGRGITRGFPEWYKEQLQEAHP